MLNLFPTPAVPQDESFFAMADTSHTHPFAEGASSAHAFVIIGRRFGQAPVVGAILFLHRLRVWYEVHWLAG